jgi:hypothetical protein
MSYYSRRPIPLSTNKRVNCSQEHSSILYGLTLHKKRHRENLNLKPRVKHTLRSQDYKTGQLLGFWLKVLLVCKYKIKLLNTKFYKEKVEPSTSRLKRFHYVK